jgi:hypothetical protein
MRLILTLLFSQVPVGRTPGSEAAKLMAGYQKLQLYSLMGTERSQMFLPLQKQVDRFSVQESSSGLNLAI